MSSDMTSDNLSLIIAVLGVVAGLLYVFVKIAIHQFNDKNETKYTSLKERIDSLCEDIREFKNTTGGKDFEKSKEVNARIVSVEGNLQDLQVKLAQEYVSKEDFKSELVEIRESMTELKVFISSVDKETREQSIILTRIDSALNSMLSS